MIHVVSAVLIKNGRVFFQQRPEDKDLAFCFETPGGKIEPDESHHAAIRRELKEELGFVIGRIAERPLWEGEVPLKHKENVFLYYYRVFDWKGDPQPLEKQGFGWFTTNEIVGLTVTPGNELAMLKVCEEATVSLHHQPCHCGRCPDPPIGRGE